MTEGTIDLHVFIPVVWALVAAGLALVLYRTSTGMFVGKGGKEKDRRLRLTGSIVIAAVIFFGLKWSTSPSLLEGDTATKAAERQAQSDAAVTALQELTACAELTVPQQCRREIDAVTERVEALRD